MDTSTRRIRHEAADGVVLMGFSLVTSVGIAGLIALLMGRS